MKYYLYYLYKFTNLGMILSLMSLNYDMLLQCIFVELTIFFHDLLQDVSFLPNLLRLTFKRNQSDLSTQLFLLNKNC